MTPRFFADDVLFDTSLNQPARGWTWCVMDRDTECVIAVCSSRAMADTIAVALNKHLDREATS